MDIDTPENVRKAVPTENLSPRTTSSRYILDKPRTTEDSFSKEFEVAMNFPQSIYPIRSIFMTFQREKEQTILKSSQQQQPQATTKRGNQGTTKFMKQVSDDQDA